MAVESHLPFGGESASSQDEDGFEPVKPRRKSRRERRAERTRSGERMPEPHTIWTREDPNHLQPLNVGVPTAERPTAKNEATPPRGEQEPAKKTEQAPKTARNERVADATEDAKPVAEQRRKEPAKPAPEIDKEQLLAPEAAMPAPQKHETPARKGTQPESLADLLKLQELPKLNIQPRHFYTEPEVRQPGTTETEHDILPSAGQEKQPAKSAAGTEQAKPAAGELPPMSDRKNVSEPQPENEPKPPLSPSKEEQRPSPSRAAEADRHEGSQANGIPVLAEQPRAGEQLQHIAEETAKRAAELADKEEHRAQPEKQAGVTPEVSEKPTTSESQADEIGVGFRMDRADLFDIGNSIRVEDVSISEMFRAGRLDEEGMRRIVAAFLRGHDVQRVIAEEVLRVQMRFELDPQLRKAALKRSSHSTKRAAGRAKTQAKKVLDPKRARYHADRLADRFADGLDRMIEVAEEKPNTAKTVGISLAVVVYFIILFLILKS
jgi:hypothetical protein